MNSAGINPIDDIAYATIQIEAEGTTKHYLVRFDRFKFEFVAQLPQPSEYGTGPGYNTATFSTSGKYYLVTQGNAQSIMVIEDLHTFDGFASQRHSSLLKYNSSTLPAQQIHSDTVQIADIACIQADFDGQAEYCFMLDFFRNMFLAKMPDKKVWKLKATAMTAGVDALKPASSRGWGAAWSFKGRVFFASNAGGGVFEVDQTSVDLEAKTIAMTYVGKSTATDYNDGMNCVDLDSPWPEQGECETGEVQVQAVGGQCPEGSDQQ